MTTIENMEKKFNAFENRFNKLKEVMISNLENLHDNLVDQMDESEAYYEAFENEFDLMIQDIKNV